MLGEAGFRGILPRFQLLIHIIVGSSKADSGPQTYETHHDEPLFGNFTLGRRDFRYSDAPGFYKTGGQYGTVKSFDGGSNVLIKLSLNGQVKCQISFHTEMTCQNNNIVHATWDEGHL
jgi:hypothetical protein